LRQPPADVQWESSGVTPAQAPCRYRLAVVRASFDWLALGGGLETRLHQLLESRSAVSEQSALH
jgi:hypothetical protein